MLNLRVAQIDLLVDLSRLEELKVVSETPASVQIGALTTHAAIEDGKIPDRFGGLLRRVASTISYRAVRNHGTIGGSVALADPAADWPGCLDRARRCRPDRGPQRDAPAAGGGFRAGRVFDLVGGWRDHSRL